MAISLTVDRTTVIPFGGIVETEGTGNLGSYVTNGVAVTAADCGLGVLDDLVVYPAGGYTFEFDKDNLKVLAYRAPAQTHNHDLLVIGGQAAASTDAVQAAAGDAILGKEEAANVTIAKADVATKGGVVSETLAAAALSEVGNVTDLSSAVFRWRARGV